MTVYHLINQTPTLFLKIRSPYKFSLARNHRITISASLVAYFTSILDHEKIINLVHKFVVEYIFGYSFTQEGLEGL